MAVGLEEEVFTTTTITEVFVIITTTSVTAITMAAAGTGGEDLTRESVESTVVESTEFGRIARLLTHSLSLY